MSKEQWGHGYHKGIEDAKSIKDGPRFVVTTDKDDHACKLFILREKYDEDNYLVEDFSEYLTNINLIGRAYVFNEDEADLSQIEEINLKDIGTYRSFRSQIALRGYLIRDRLRWLEENDWPAYCESMRMIEKQSTETSWADVYKC